MSSCVLTTHTHDTVRLHDDVDVVRTIQFKLKGLLTRGSGLRLMVFQFTKTSMNPWLIFPYGHHGSRQYLCTVGVLPTRKTGSTVYRIQYLCMRSIFISYLKEM
jgi:hypothetical protein